MARARTWAAVVCLMISSPSSESTVMTDRAQSISIGSLKSFCIPSMLTAIALFARPGPIDKATSRPVTPFGNSLIDLSGSVIFIKKQLSS